MPAIKYRDWDAFEAAARARLDRLAAYRGGNLAALYDAFLLAVNGTPASSALVSLPDWVREGLKALGAPPSLADPRVELTPADAVLAADQVQAALRTAVQGRGSHARWWRRYRADLIDWHRFEWVWMAHLPGDPDRPTYGWNADNLGTGRAKHAPDLDAFQIVSDKIACTVAAGAPESIRDSYRRVTARTAAGQWWRYYPSHYVVV